MYFINPSPNQTHVTSWITRSRHERRKFSCGSRNTEFFQVGFPRLKKKIQPTFNINVEFVLKSHSTEQNLFLSVEEVYTTINNILKNV